MTRLDEAIRALRPPPPPAAPAAAPLPTGLPGLDALLDGGIQGGKLLTLHGDPGSGKTTLALQLCQAAQRSGAVAYVDGDCALSLSRAAALGVSLPRLLYAAPSLSRLAGILSMLAGAEGLSLIVVEAAGGWPGPPAALRRLRQQVVVSGAAVLFVTQRGQRPGVCWGGGIGAPRGADALAFASHVRLQLEVTAQSFSGLDLCLRRLGRPARLRLRLHHDDGRIRPS
jgi:RecA/RadA recombinase